MLSRFWTLYTYLLLDEFVLHTLLTMYIGYCISQVEPGTCCCIVDGTGDSSSTLLLQILAGMF